MREREFLVPPIPAQFVGCTPSHSSFCNTSAPNRGAVAPKLGPGKPDDLGVHSLSDTFPSAKPVEQ